MAPGAASTRAAYSASSASRGRLLLADGDAVSAQGWEVEVSASGGGASSSPGTESISSLIARATTSSEARGPVALGGHRGAEPGRDRGPTSNPARASPAIGLDVDGVVRDQAVGLRRGEEPGDHVLVGIGVRLSRAQLAGGEEVEDLRAVARRHRSGCRAAPTTSAV